MNSNVVQQSDFFNWSLSQLAREFGMARDTISRRLFDADVKASGERRGHPVYSVSAAAKAILGLHLNQSGVDVDPAKMTASDRRHHYAGELDKLKLERELGLSISIDDARSQMVEIIKMGLPIFESLPDELERSFDLPPDVIASVEDKVNELRNSWADALEGIS